MPILSLITYAPLVGVAGILALRLFGKANDPRTIEASKWIALVTTLATLALSVLLVVQFNPHESGFQFVEEAPWFAGLSYRMGVDGISVLFVLLTAFLMPLCIVASWKPITRVSRIRKAIRYSSTRLVIEVQDAAIQSGIRNAVSSTNSTEMPSTPMR